MKRPKNARSQTAPTVILLTATLFVSAAYGQSVADLARQERARKAGVEAKIKVTNETIKNSPAPAPSVVGKPATTEAAAPPKPTDGKTTGPTDRNGRDEKTWRAAFSEARAELKDAEDQIQIIQAKQNQARLDYMTKSDLYNRELRLAAEINALNKDMEAQQTRAENARKKIEALEEELRRSGGPPGWAR